MDRRQFLDAAAAGVVLILVGVPRAADATRDPHDLAHPDLLALLGPEAVRAIGQRYCDAVLTERDAEALRAAFVAQRPGTARLRFGPRAPTAALVGGDFAEGRTVLVDGWVLSATEARQCALFSLLSA